MRRTVFLLMLVMTAACGTDSFDIMDPVAANVTSSQTNAVVTVDGTQYEIGCPDFPCPVTSIVLDHIARRLWFWMPPGTFAHPTIYLYVLRVPVQLHDLTPTVILPPIQTQPVPPSLTGPTSWKGTTVGPINQVTCGRFPLNLNSPDNGPWDFVSGLVTFEYVTWNSTTSMWVPTGVNSVVGFSFAAWEQMLAGSYTLYPPLPTMDYNAKFAVTLSRGSVTVQVNHTMLCSRTQPPPPPPVIAPPPPSLDGPIVELGTRSGPGTPLMCADVQLTLISPDNGPWSFVSGQRKIEFYSWDVQKHVWYLNGNMSTAALSSGDWQALLNGTYDLSPGLPSGPYQATFTFTLERGQYQHTISHAMACGGHDFVDMQGS